MKANAIKIPSQVGDEADDAAMADLRVKLY
jgi:hypothetical protein